MSRLHADLGHKSHISISMTFGMVDLKQDHLKKEYFNLVRPSHNTLYDKGKGP
jgi:hypothetical protein